MWVIGLTGGIGSGKSTVARWLADQGIPILDADCTVHELLANDQETIAEVVSEFGVAVQHPDGGIDRKALGRQVFSDDKARACLEGILHPRVAASMGKQQAKLEGEGVRLCIWDVPLLYETDFTRWVDEIWVVWLPRTIQQERVRARDALSMKEIEQRIQAQHDLEEKAQKANVVIDNSGTWDQTEVQLRKELARIKKEHQL